MSHLIKILNYMYHLHKRNIKCYFKPMLNPIYNEPLYENCIHWVGHATTLINIGGKLVVTDPVTSLTLGHLKRLVKPSLNLSSINIDYILLSHSHMDHMDFNTLRKLNKNAIIIIPKCFQNILKILGFKKTYCLNYGETYEDNFIKIKALEANHDGRRYFIGSGRKSNSYIIEGNSKKIFFAGDTAYTNKYKDIYADAAIMPVGCYKPDEFQKMHCSPEQSFKMFKMTKSKFMIPVHYKTYILAQDNDKETYNTLINLNDGSIKIIDIGQTIKI